nr:MAG TPA: hypothetical protein [Caudoviricetes sp.]
MVLRLYHNSSGTNQASTMSEQATKANMNPSSTQR